MKSRLVLRRMTLLMIMALLGPGKPPLMAAQSQSVSPAAPALSPVLSPVEGVVEGLPPAPDHARVAETLRSAPVMFIENVGQFHDGARFQVWGGPGTMWLAEDAIWITVFEQRSKGAEEPGRDSLPHLRASAPRPRRTVNLKLSFPGANPHPHIEPFGRVDTVVSYFIGNDPDQWHPDVPVWGGVRYVDMYPGVDLEVTSEGGRWTWRFAVRDSQFAISNVRLRVHGADKIALDGDRLRLTTAPGQCILPLFQAVSADGSPLPRAGEGLGMRTNEITAPFAPANPAAVGGQPSAVAPAGAYDLLYSTFLGGSNGECLWPRCAMAVDSNGAAYVAGETYSSDFPTTPDAFDTTYNGDGDAFVVKLNTTGSALIYAAFLGGGNSDWGLGIAVDGSGTSYVTGRTESPDFPATPDVFDTTHNGSRDVFVVKLNATGSALVYATFLGGDNWDEGDAIAVDEAGNVYMTGVTISSDFPTTPGAFDRDRNGSFDAFVAKLNASGTTLVYATFLGGGSSEWGLGIAVDGSGTSYVTGRTESSDFPTTLGAFDTTYDGDFDAFVVKLNPSDSVLGYATFLGGSHSDGGYGIAIDGSGASYVTGETGSPNFPTTLGAFDTTHGGGTCGTASNPYPCPDAFVVKLNATGSALAYATFLGGSYGECLWPRCAIAVDGGGAAYVTGVSDSSDFPTTPDAFDRTCGTDGNCNFDGTYRYGDAFVAKLNATGSALVYATFLGGSGYDDGQGIALDGSEAVYVAGETWFSDFPTTPGAFDTTFNGSSDAFVAKLAVEPNAQNVELVGWIGGTTDAVAVQGNYAYLIGDGLRVVDVSDPHNPREVGYCDTPGYDVFISDCYAYVGTNDAMRVIDVSDPADPYEVGSYEKEHPYGSLFARVVVSGDYAYVLRTAVGAGTLQVLNVSDPYNPYEVSGYDPLGYPEGVFVSGPYAYVTSTDTATWVGSLRVVDVSDPHNPYEVGYYDTLGYPRGVFVSGTYAYIAEGPQLGGSEPRGLRVVDISNPYNPHGVGFCDMPGDAYGVFVSGPYAYVAAGDGGLQVIDVSDPANPRQVGYYDTPGFAQDVFVSNSYAYVAIRDEGLLILRFTGGADTTPPTVVSTSPEDGATGVAIDTVITATFSEPMDSSTINTDGFTLVGSAVSGTVTYDPDTYTATFTPDANLDYDHEYAATLSTAITDEAGNPLAEPCTWSFATGSAQPPTAHASDISDQPQTMYPDTTYSVTTEYYDLDGSDDLKHCYLQLRHPLKRLTMMWYQSDGSWSPWAGEEGANYLTITGVTSTELANGYELTWSFKINDNWPQAENSIDFGVSACDDNDLESGWDYDNTKASFINVIPPTQPTNVFPEDGATDINLAITLTSSPFSRGPSQWQITTAPGDYSNPVFDELSYEHSAYYNAIILPSGVLDYGTTYYWRTRYRDDYGVWSDWSKETSLTTVDVPHASFTYSPSPPYNPIIGEEITFDASSSKGNIRSYTWDFGDDSEPITTGWSITSHSYSYEGEYIVKLTVIDTDGTEGDFTEAVTIKRPPVILVHGFSAGDYNSDDLWRIMKEGDPDKGVKGLEDYDFTVYVSHYAPGDGVTCLPVKKYAEFLGEEIERIRGEGREEVDQVDIVAHSMGGLVARWYIEVGDEAKDGGHAKNVRKLIMLETPNHGFNDELLALFTGGFAQPEVKSWDSIKDMTWGSEFLRRLNCSYINWDQCFVWDPNAYPAGEEYPYSDVISCSNHPRAHYEILASQQLYNKSFPGRWKGRYVLDLDQIEISEDHKFDFGLLSLLKAHGMLRTDEKVIQRIVAILNDDPEEIGQIQAEAQGSSIQFAPLISDQISPNEQKTHEISISSTTEVNFILGWAEGILNSTLTTPNATLIDASYAASDANVSYDEATEPISYKGYAIKNPEQGIWKVNVIATDIAETEDYAIMTLLETDISLSLELQEYQYDPNEPINVRAKLTYGGEPVTNTSVVAKIERPDDTIETLTLYDDGLHNDYEANDGIYANTFINTSLWGAYDIAVTTSGTLDTEEFAREASDMVWVEQYPDLALSESDIYLSNNDPDPGERITIKAKIHDIGKADANNASILFYAGNPVINGTLIGEDIVDIEARKTAEASLEWTAVWEVKEIYVLINPYNEFLEENYANNIAFARIIHQREYRIYLPLVTKNYPPDTTPPAAITNLATNNPTLD